MQKYEKMEKYSLAMGIIDEIQRKSIAGLACENYHKIQYFNHRNFWTIYCFFTLWPGSGISSSGAALPF